MPKDDICVDISEQGYLFVTPQGLSECTSYVLVSSSNYDSYIADFEITAEEITEAFGYGFAAIIIFGYFAAYPVGIAKKLIRKL
ncbi:hypothetical protein LRP52_02420 [Photobacterium sp. ZSDE20]|uniref:Single-stranded DNA-binding protein n=1 Tax=Photobacterium pectinilyticum TaxID=2906793 RepID=A0ABT1MWS9_9GAMM|nr:hypothetical protein [Photobacterium sp. ZSDE20]MCQ1056925.1 hypothetical protein [Photobacterium sp. ZSDE20]MDD1821060.1 hypothetical protein [Photobacterium sp. ZSDE20]